MTRTKSAQRLRDVLRADKNADETFAKFHALLGGRSSFVLEFAGDLHRRARENPDAVVHSQQLAAWIKRGKVRRRGEAPGGIAYEVA